MVLYIIVKVILDVIMEMAATMVVAAGLTKMAAVWMLADGNSVDVGRWQQCRCWQMAAVWMLADGSSVNVGRWQQCGCWQMAAVWKLVDGSSVDVGRWQQCGC